MLPGWSLPLIFIVGAISQYLGAAVGVFLFETTEPATVAWIRAVAAGLVLLAWRRPWRITWTRRMVTTATAFGVVTVAMNIAFYEAIARIPLGTAVAIEFLGPVAVASFGSRRPRDLVAVALVTAGVGLLAGIQLDVEPVGVAFAVTAAVLWAGYIVMGKKVASAGDGQDSLAVGMAGAAVVLAPVVLSIQLSTDASVFGDPRTWILGAGVGVLSSALPYALDQVVLTAMGRQRFAMLLALLPATAVVVGAVVLAQWPHVTELIGVGVVMLALTVAALPNSARPRRAPSTNRPRAPDEASDSSPPTAPGQLRRQR